MKGKFSFVLCVLLSLCSVNTFAKGNLQKGNRYLYCHMNDAGPAWTAYALSRDGRHWHDLLNGDSIFSDAEMAPIEKRSRDAFICRKHDDSGYLMVFTDMDASQASRNRMGKLETWDNYGICLLTSDDLIHWKSKSYDFRKGTAIFCNPQGESVYKDWSTINRVWAPQIVWDEDFAWPDGRKGGYMIYYSMWNRAEEKYDRMYYSHADESFTQLTQPQLLFDWGYATIDADINWVEADRQWHMMIKKEGGKPGLFTATAPSLTGPWSEPVEDDYVNFEGNKKCEGVSAFQLEGSDTWMIGYIEYSSKPRNYRICEADRFMRNFKNPKNIEGVDRPQHGSFMRITEEEYDRLQNWSDSIEALTLKPNAKNPLIEGLYADPEILFSKKDGKYYLYPTTDGAVGWNNHDFRCYSSSNLKDWTYEGVIIDLPTDCDWADSKGWAPCIIEKHVKGKGKRAKYKYYYYFVAESKIGVAVADHPAGPFKVSAKPLISQRPSSEKGGQAIDPDVFQDPKTGKYYLYWGNGFLACSELNNDMVSLKDTTILIPRAQKQAFHYNEGTYVFERNGLYYFTWSENDTRSKNYRVRYLISESPTAFVRNGRQATVEKQVLLEKDPKQQIYGTGHHAILRLPDQDEWRIVYHRFQRPNAVKLDWNAGFNREVCIDALEFNDDGTLLPVKPTL